jgi:transposase
MPLSKPKRAKELMPLGDERLYIGIDIGKSAHLAGFVSTTLLRQQEFTLCPFVRFGNSRQDFSQLIEYLRSSVPLEQCCVLLEYTGHYHKALLQYLEELDIRVYIMHVLERPEGLAKTDARDSLRLANHLYNQVEKCIQVANKTELVRRLIPPTATAAAIRNLIQHHMELVKETTRRKNKLIAICDELFPEFTVIFKDPNRPTALAFRTRYPTPADLASASLADLKLLRTANFPSNARLAELQELAVQSIGTKDPHRKRGLVIEQTQLIKELILMEDHIKVLETEIQATFATSREGRIVMSVPGWGPMQAAVLIAGIGNIANFPTAAAFQAYCGWVPKIEQSGSSIDNVHMYRGGNRNIKGGMFLVVSGALRDNNEWKRLYDRLVRRKCEYDPKTGKYKHTMNVIARIANQMLSVIYQLLKSDQMLLQDTAAGQTPPEPMLYNPAIHKLHINGKYQPSKP